MYMFQIKYRDILKNIDTEKNGNILLVLLVKV